MESMRENQGTDAALGPMQFIGNLEVLLTTGWAFILFGDPDKTGPPRS